MYYFYMGSVLLPIAPEKFTLKVNNSNKTVTLINEGEVNILKEAKLTDLEFDALIPAVQYSFANYDGGFKPTTYFTNHFEKLKTEKKPFQFVVTRKMPNGKLLFDTNLTVSMESYTIKEDAKQGFDLVISFKLKQYRSFGTKVVKVSTPVTTKPSGSASPQQTTAPTATATVSNTRPAEPKAPLNKKTTYTVKKGDCLWNIAKKLYGYGSYYTVIYNANKNKIKNPNVISAGQVLTIPSMNDAVKEKNSAKNKTSSTGNKGGNSKVSIANKNTNLGT